MADELTLSASFKYAPSGFEEFVRSQGSVLQDVSGSGLIFHKVSITTSEMALDVGGLSSLGYAWFLNLDATNYVKLLTGTGGTEFARLYPGVPLIIRLGAGITAPYAAANSSACVIEYCILAP